MGSACNVARGSYVNHQDTLLAHSCGLLADDTRVEVMPGDPYRVAVFAADAGSEITLNAVHLTFTVNSPGGLVSASGPASTGVWAQEGSNPLKINEKPDLSSADGVGLRTNNGGHIQIGADSEIRGATVTAQTLWSASGSDYTFNAQGGTYTGKSMGNPLILKMNNAAGVKNIGSNRWHLRSSPYTGANVASVPTLSHPGLLLTGGLLAGAAARARRKQKKA